MRCSSRQPKLSRWARLASFHSVIRLLLDKGCANGIQLTYWQKKRKALDVILKLDSFKSRVD